MMSLHDRREWLEGIDVACRAPLLCHSGEAVNSDMSMSW